MVVIATHMTSERHVEYDELTVMYWKLIVEGNTLPSQHDISYTRTYINLIQYRLRSEFVRLYHISWYIVYSTNRRQSMHIMKRFSKHCHNMVMYYLPFMGWCTLVSSNLLNSQTSILKSEVVVSVNERESLSLNNRSLSRCFAAYGIFVNS